MNSTWEGVSEKASWRGWHFIGAKKVNVVSEGKGGAFW